MSTKDQHLIKLRDNGMIATYLFTSATLEDVSSPLLFNLPSRFGRLRGRASSPGDASPDVGSASSEPAEVAAMSFGEE